MIECEISPLKFDDNNNDVDKVRKRAGLIVSSAAAVLAAKSSTVSVNNIPRINPNTDGDGIKNDNGTLERQHGKCINFTPRMDSLRRLAFTTASYRKKSIMPKLFIRRRRSDDYAWVIFSAPDGIASLKATQLPPSAEFIPTLITR
ncbi:hypothetical protein CHUAL_007516 [Chamberlinius hualienensis]